MIPTHWIRDAIYFVANYGAARRTNYRAKRRESAKIAWALATKLKKGDPRRYEAVERYTETGRMD